MNFRLRFVNKDSAVTATAVLLIALLAALSWTVARRESVTFDEVAHIGAGLNYLQKLDMRFNEEHPPLSKLLAAIPLTLSGTRADYAGPVWTHSASFFSGLAGQWVFGSEILLRWNDPRRTLALARFPMLLLSLILGWTIFHMARRLGGDEAGIMCLIVYASSPLFLGLGALVMTDVALTLFALLSIWTFANLWDQPNRRNMLLFSGAFSGALLSKFSSGILFFAIGAFILVSWRRPDRAADVRPRLYSAMKGMLLAAVWVYLFCTILSWNQPNDVPWFGGGLAPPVFGRLLMAPWIYFRGIVLFVVMAGGSSFILGHDYPNGVWFYFPVLLILKSAPGFLGLLALLPVAMLQKKRTSEQAVVPKVLSSLPNHWRMISVTLIVFGGICMLSHYNTDFRHFSFPVVLLILLLSAWPRTIRSLSPSATAQGFCIAVGVLLVSCVATAGMAFPNYLSYTSSFGLGRPGWALVSSGNLDRGQSLYDVAHFARDRGIVNLPVDLYAATDLSIWVPEGRLWNCQTAGPAEAGSWVVVSANMILRGHRCAWMMQYPHQELGGGSMIAIRLPAAIPPAGTGTRPATIPVNPLRRFGLDLDLYQAYVHFLDHPEAFPAIVGRFDEGASAEAQRKLRRMGEILRSRGF